MLITYLSPSNTALTTRKVSYKDIILVRAKKICNQNISLVSYFFEPQLKVTPYMIADRIVVACKVIVGAAGDIEIYVEGPAKGESDSKSKDSA